MCDTLCVLAGDRVLFAKSSDRPFGEVQVFEAWAARAAGGVLRTQYLSVLDHGAAALVGAWPTWLWGLEHGVNEHRVAIGNERIWTVDDAGARPPALLGMDLVRLGLERARTAEAALDLMTNLIGEHGQGGVGEEATGEAYFSSFLVADPVEAWILETSDRTWAAKRVDPRRMRGASISNRVTLGTDWTKASANVPPGANFQRWRDLEYPTPHADQRIAATGAVATATPAPTARDLAAVLRHHGGHPWGAPGAAGSTATEREAPAIDPLLAARISRDGTGVSVCMHLRGWEATTGAMIAELPQDPAEPVRAWATLGNPCVGVFVPVFPPAQVPAALSDPATWHRFAILKARVEAARDAADREATAGGTGVEALASIRAVLAPLETAFWDEADEATTQGPSARVDLMHSISPRLDRALTSLGA